MTSESEKVQVFFLAYMGSLNHHRCSETQRAWGDTQKRPIQTGY